MRFKALSGVLCVLYRERLRKWLKSKENGLVFWGVAWGAGGGWGVFGGLRGFESNLKVGKSLYLA